MVLRISRDKKPERPTKTIRNDPTPEQLLDFITAPNPKSVTSNHPNRGKRILPDIFYPTHPKDLDRYLTPTVNITESRSKLLRVDPDSGSPEPYVRILNHLMADIENSIEFRETLPSRIESLYPDYFRKNDPETKVLYNTSVPVREPNDPKDEPKDPDPKDDSKNDPKNDPKKEEPKDPETSLQKLKKDVLELSHAHGDSVTRINSSYSGTSGNFILRRSPYQRTPDIDFIRGICRFINWKLLFPYSGDPSKPDPEEDIPLGTILSPNPNPINNSNLPYADISAYIEASRKKTLAQPQRHLIYDYHRKILTPYFTVSSQITKENLSRVERSKAEKTKTYGILNDLTQLPITGFTETTREAYTRNYRLSEDDSHNKRIKELDNHYFNLLKNHPKYQNLDPKLPLRYLDLSSKHNFPQGSTSSVLVVYRRFKEPKIEPIEPKELEPKELEPKELEPKELEPKELEISDFSFSYRVLKDLKLDLRVHPNDFDLMSAVSLYKYLVENPVPKSDPKFSQYYDSNYTPPSFMHNLVNPHGGVTLTSNPYELVNFLRIIWHAYTIEVDKSHTSLLKLPENFWLYLRSPGDPPFKYEINSRGFYYSSSPSPSQEQDPESNPKDPKKPNKPNKPKKLKKLEPPASSKILRYRKLYFDNKPPEIYVIPDKDKDKINEKTLEDIKSFFLSQLRIPKYPDSHINDDPDTHFGDPKDDPLDPKDPIRDPPKGRYPIAKKHRVELRNIKIPRPYEAFPSNQIIYRQASFYKIKFLHPVTFKYIHEHLCPLFPYLNERFRLSPNIKHHLSKPISIVSLNNLEDAITYIYHTWNPDHLKLFIDPNDPDQDPKYNIILRKSYLHE